MISGMESMRRARLREKRTLAMQDRFHNLHRASASFRTDAPGEFFPEDRDLASCEEFRTIIDVDSDLDIDIEHFEPLRPLIRDIVNRWKDEKTAIFVDHIRNKYELDKDVDVLSLAACFAFTCSTCSLTLSFPHVLSHTCYYRTVRIGERYDPDDYESCADLAMYAATWEPNEFATLANHVNPIISVCGLDTKKATQDDMDERNALLVCDSCPMPGIKAVMTWRTAVSLHSSLYFVLGLNVSRRSHMRPRVI